MFSYINSLHYLESFTPEIRGFYRPIVRNTRMAVEGFYERTQKKMNDSIDGFYKTLGLK
jgi:hypothetical protein